MAFRHYGGSTPAPATSWVCPSCATEQDGPLKAGCQKCGAGADAKKVKGLSPETHALIAEEKREDHTRAVSAQEWAAAVAWMQASDFPDTQVTPWANSETVREAFMAGVAWAQGQTPVGQSYAELTGERPEPQAGGTLYLGERNAIVDSAEELDAPTLQTILAALAFYRDNQLGYGPVPGQLTAEQVNALIARLSPQEDTP